MHPFQGGVEILVVSSRYRNLDINFGLIRHLVCMVTLLYHYWDGSDKECEL